MEHRPGVLSAPAVVACPTSAPPAAACGKESAEVGGTAAIGGRLPASLLWPEAAAAASPPREPPS